MVNQRTLSFAALGMSFVAMLVALWVLLTGPPPPPAGRAGLGERGGPSARAGKSRGHRPGVRARSSDAAGDSVFGAVVDPELGPVESGILSFECVETGRPIRGGNFRLGEGGEFESVGCGGPVCAQLRHPSYVQEEAWILKPGKHSELLVRGMAQLRGSVSADGVPVPAAKITVVPAEEDPMALPPLLSRSTQSDADGSFSLSRVELPPCDACAQARGQCEKGEARRDVLYRGPLSLLVTAPGFRALSQELEGMPEHVLELELELDLNPLSGNLRGADGLAFPRAEVVARSQTRRHESHRVPVKGQRFELPGLGEGAYDLRVIQDGIELAKVQGVESGARLELESDRRAVGVELRVEVVNAQGEATVGARVDGGPFGRGQTVNEMGVATQADVLVGSYRVRVWLPGKKPVRRAVEVGSAPQTLRVEL